MEIRNSPNKFGQTTFSSVLYGKILGNYIIPFRIKCFTAMAVFTFPILPPLLFGRQDWRLCENLKKKFLVHFAELFFFSQRISQLIFSRMLFSRHSTSNIQHSKFHQTFRYFAVWLFFTFSSPSGTP